VIIEARQSSLVAMERSGIAITLSSIVIVSTYLISPVPFSGLLNPEDIVIDPFGDTGSTYAAEAFNRKWLGTETKIEYCDIIKRRLLNREHIARIADDNEEAEII